MKEVREILNFNISGIGLDYFLVEGVKIILGHIIEGMLMKLTLKLQECNSTQYN